MVGGAAFSGAREKLQEPDYPAAEFRCATFVQQDRQEGLIMTMRPDPTFYASPKLAMEAPPESFAYTLLLSPDFSKQ
jgi:hypothetical protein